MKKLALSVLLLCFFGVSGAASAQPLLECAEKFVPAIKEPQGRLAVTAALARGYAQHGSFDKAQSLLDAAPRDQVEELGRSAAMGALGAGHLAHPIPQAIEVAGIGWCRRV